MRFFFQTVLFYSEGSLPPRHHLQEDLMGFRLSYDYLLSVPRPAGPIVVRPEKGSQQQTSVSTPWSTGGLRWRGPGRQAITSAVRLAAISSPISLSQTSGSGATSALTAQVNIPSTLSQLIFLCSAPAQYVDSDSSENLQTNSELCEGRGPGLARSPLPPLPVSPVRSVSVPASLLPSPYPNLSSSAWT